MKNRCGTGARQTRDWESDDDPPLQLFRMMEGTVHQQWEVWTGEGGETGRLDDLLLWSVRLTGPGVEQKWYREDSKR